MNILLLGGSGFIGRHLAARLRASGHQLQTPTHKELDLRALDERAARTCLRGQDAVVNAVGIMSRDADRLETVHHHAPATLAAWAALWYWLTRIGSTVPVADAFTTALSFVGIWALARKYLEQWLIWIVVDVVTCALYFYKDIPFKASLYALYVVIAAFGYMRWRRKMQTN